MTHWNHPSFYALDRLKLGLTVSPGMPEHVQACASCQAHLQGLGGPVALPSAVARRIENLPPAEAPGFLKRLLSSVRLWRSAAGGGAAGRLRRWALAPALGVVALVVAVTIGTGLAPPTPAGQEGYRTKGEPQVTVHVKRGDVVSLWEPDATLRPGDSLRLGFHPMGYRFISVASLPSDGGPLTLLYAGPVEPQGASLLPVSWRIDDRGQKEVLSVVLSATEVKGAVHAQGTIDDRARLWRRVITLPKETSK